MSNIACIILAGGRSSRMGTNKALLEYKGKILIEHMVDLLKSTELGDIYISGEVEGYKTIPDSQKFQGPACAIIDVMTQLNDYDGALFVPVDMPLLTPEILRSLISYDGSAYFKNHPLPLHIMRATMPNIGEYEGKPINSVKDVIKSVNAKAIGLPIEFEKYMQNINTPEDLAALL